MNRRTVGWLSLGLLAGVSLLAPQAKGQAMPSSNSSNGMGMGMGAMYANPYTNPYANPFLNPYMTQNPTNGNAALYFFAAQQANGGIGSGRLSGLRAPKPEPVAAPADPDARRTTDIPGGGAARFFNRSPQTQASVNRYYNRSMRYRPSNRK